MTLVAVTGDAATTTAVALTIALAAGRQPGSTVLVELDGNGGALSGWLDVPRSPGLADIAAASTTADWSTVCNSVQRSERGVDVLVAPVRSVEAAAVIATVESSLTRALAASPDGSMWVADGGARRGLSPLVTMAQATVVTHRQRHSAPAAAAIGLERLAETVHGMQMHGVQPIVAVIGEAPYGIDEVNSLLGVATVAVADDPWAAAVLAGRPGSARRLARAPLTRSVAALAAVVGRRLDPQAFPSLPSSR